MKVLSAEDKKLSTETHDSKTNVYLRLSAPRDVISVRVRKELKQAFKGFCLANGLTECHIWESLVTGFLVGVEQKIELVNKSPTINLNVVREVQRIRRYSREYVDDTGMRYCALNHVCVSLNHVCSSSCPNKKCLEFMRRG